MRKQRCREFVLVLALSVFCETAALAQSTRAKPQPPVGVDPGGVAIGLITTGIDYTLPTVARCLARDGEGHLIAWDVVDRDPLPFGGNNDESSSAFAIACAGRIRFVPTRVDQSDAVTFSRAIAFLATTPTRVVLVPASISPADWAPLFSAAAKFQHLLIVIASNGNLTNHPTASRPNIVVTRHFLEALAQSITLVACNPKTRDPSLTGATLAMLWNEQVAQNKNANQLNFTCN